ncbi:hypothetical protein FPQ18DRAFT_342333, partial [Pyronema domesticum]
MAERPQQKQPFKTTTPARRSNIKLQRIFDDTIIDKPRVVPASRRPLNEAREVNEVRKANPARKNGNKPPKFEIHQDVDTPKKDATLKPSASRSRNTLLKPPPAKRDPSRSPKKVQIQTPPAPEQRARIPRLPPTTLTSLLLSHASPTPALPPLPPPPKSRAPPPKPRTSTSAPNLRHPHPSSTPITFLPAATSEISLASLPPLQHHSALAILSLSPPHYLTLTLRGSPYTYRITASSPPIITVTDRPTGSKETYPLPELPYKHLAAYKYARRFVIAVRRKTVVAYGAIAGAQGRVWADGRGVITFDTGSIEIMVEKDAGTGKGVIRMTGPEELKKEAERVYRWLQMHPRPIYEEKEEEQWLGEGTRFVKGLG